MHPSTKALFNFLNSLFKSVALNLPFAILMVR